MFDLGSSLREARVRQGLDYPQVELATKIRAKYIRALEEEDFTSIPGDAYIRGFLRSYAEYLGLDGQLYVDEYNSRYGSERWYEETPRRARVHQHRGVEVAGSPPPNFHATITSAVTAAIPASASSTTFRSIERSCRTRGRRCGMSSKPSTTWRELYSST